MIASSGQVIEQRRRRLAGRASGQMARVVLDAVAVADLADHLEVEHRPLVQALGLEQPPFLLEVAATFGQLFLDRLDRLLGPLARRHEVRLRIDGGLVVPVKRLAGQRVEGGQRVHVVAEQLDAQSSLFVRRVHLDDVAADAERAAAEIVVVALVLNLDQLAQDLFAGDALSALERQQHAVVGLRRSEAVDARHAGDDDDVAAFEERPGRGQAHAVDLFVDGRFLLDVGVGGRDVGLRLVVVVVADEVLDRVVRKKAAELLVELRGQGLVVDHDQRRTVHPGDRLRHGERLARTGDAEQHLMRVAAVESGHELADGALLIAGQGEIGDEVEAVVHGRHTKLASYQTARSGG